MHRRFVDANHGSVSRPAQQHRADDMPPASGGAGALQVHSLAGCAAQQALQAHELCWSGSHGGLEGGSADAAEVAWMRERDVPDLNLSPPDEAACSAAACQWRSGAETDCGDAPSQTLLDTLAGAAVRLADEQRSNVSQPSAGAG